MKLFSPRNADRPGLSVSMDREFGRDWAVHLPERLLEAVWDGDTRAVDSDARRFARVLPRVAPPGNDVRASVDFLSALFAAASRWTRVSPGYDPEDDAARVAEVEQLFAEREGLRAGRPGQRVPRHGRPEEVLSGVWVEHAADLIVRSVRFRDGFTGPELVRRFDHLVTLDGPGYEQCLVPLALMAGRIVNGSTEGARNGEDCMNRIRRRFGGEYPFAAAMAAAMTAIRQRDGEALRELADLTAAAAGDPDSPARVLHNLVLAGEKVLYARA